MIIAITIPPATQGKAALKKSPIKFPTPFTSLKETYSYFAYVLIKSQTKFVYSAASSILGKCPLFSNSFI